MPKNKGKGGKNRRRGKNENESAKRELVYKDQGQEYGLVKQVLGGNRLLVQCMDSQTRVCIIRGKMRKKVWIGVNDYVLASLREYEPNIGDIVYKYNNDEVRQLRMGNEICELTPSNATDDILFTAETKLDEGNDSDTLPDVLEGFHNPNRPINPVSGSDEEDSDSESDDSDEDDSSEEESTDSEDEKERDREETRRKIASLGLDEILSGNPAKVDYSVNTNRKAPNTLLEMSKGGETDESSEDDDQKNLQTNAELLSKLSAFRKNVGYDRSKKSNKKN